MITSGNNPFDLSTSVSHETHERADSDRHPIERDNESFRSPAGSRERAGAQGHSVENDHDPLQSPYARKKARARAAVEPILPLVRMRHRLRLLARQKVCAGTPIDSLWISIKLVFSHVTRTTAYVLGGRFLTSSSRPAVAGFSARKLPLAFLAPLS